MPADPESEPLPQNAGADEPVYPTGLVASIAGRNPADCAHALTAALELHRDSADPAPVRNDLEPGALTVLGAELCTGGPLRPILQRRPDTNPGGQSTAFRVCP